MAKFDVYQATTDKFVEAIEEALKGDKKLPWEKPWHALGAQQNFNSKRPYRGFVNQLMLLMAGFDSPYWATFNGWQEAAYRQWAKANKVKFDKADVASLLQKYVKLTEKTENVQAFVAAGGGGVQKGSTGTMVIWWNRVTNKKHDENDPESGPPSFFLLKSYKVFNIEQTSGIEAPKVEEREFNPIEVAEQVWEGYEGRPELSFNGSSAHYSPPKDEIGMPKREQFKSENMFYSVFFHEIIHSTGHKDRLNRPLEGQMARESYSKEELIAEMGSAMLMAHTGLEPKPTKNNVAYIKSWLGALKDDPKMIVQASSKSAAACDKVLGITYENDDDAKKDDDKKNK